MYTLHVTNSRPQVLNYPVNEIPDLIPYAPTDNNQDITLTKLTTGVQQISLTDNTDNSLPNTQPQIPVSNNQPAFILLLL